MTFLQYLFSVSFSFKLKSDSFCLKNLKVRDLYDNSINLQYNQTRAEFFNDKLVRDTNYTEKYER